MNVMGKPINPTEPVDERAGTNRFDRVLAPEVVSLEKLGKELPDKIRKELVSFINQAFIFEGVSP
jgi:hypothetical protein